jgi:geranylgeranylglycerol-phosphate geranylgeranyltransferase
VNITSHPPTQDHGTSHASGPLSLVSDLLALSHIFNGLSSAAAVAIGYLAVVWYYGLSVNGGAFITAVLATMCLSNGGFIVNDIFDLEIDRINRPDRPLAAGRVSVSAAWILYGIYTIVGIILAGLNGPALGLLGAVIAVGLFLYSYDLKKRFLLGHIIIGMFGGLLLPFGGLAAGSTVLFLTFPITFSAFFGREVLKTVPDAEGDRANGVVNITTRYGAPTAVRVTQVTLVICALALPALRLFWTLNNWYLGAVLLVIWPVTALLLTRLSKPDPDGKNVQLVLRLTKLMFLLVAAAILIGTFR